MLIRVKVEDLPKGNPNSNPVHNYVRELVKQKVDLNTQIEFYRESSNWDFRITNLRKYAKDAQIKITSHG